MQTLKRINLDTVKEAFLTNHITPETGKMSQCVMGAVCFPLRAANARDFTQYGFDQRYVYGVMDGFDWGDIEYSTWKEVVDVNDLVYKIGRADGVAARKIVDIID